MSSVCSLLLVLHEKQVTQHNTAQVPRVGVWNYAINKDDSSPANLQVTYRQWLSPAYGARQLPLPYTSYLASLLAVPFDSLHA